MLINEDNNPIFLNQTTQLIRCYLKEKQNQFRTTEYVQQLKACNNLLIGSFDVKYNPHLSEEYALYEEVTPSLCVHNTKARAVRFVKASQGLRNKKTVAIFPENFRNNSPRSSDLSFYLTDNFERRFFDYTSNFISQHNLEERFTVQNLNSKDLSEVISNWVHLHETFHESGFLPLSTNLKLKSSRLIAGLEELRADVSSMIFLLNEISTKKIAQMTFEFIFLERFFSYPLHRAVNTFDSISSVLANKKLGYIRGQKLILPPTRRVAGDLKILFDWINKIEYRASCLPQSQRRSFLENEIKNVLLGSNHIEIFFKSREMK